MGAVHHYMGGMSEVDELHLNSRVRASDSDSSRAKLVIAGLSLFVCLAVVVVVYALPGSEASAQPGPLATINAGLNSLASMLLVLGYVFVRRRELVLHRRCMVAAFVVSSLFLITYLAHHYQVGSVPYAGQGLMRTIYFSLLVPHIVLAAAVVPLALLTIYRAKSGRFAAHRRVARITLPIWLFVSLSGVLVYWMLYYT